MCPNPTNLSNNQKTKELHDRARTQSAKSQIRTINNEFKEDLDHRMERFRRIIRDGVAEDIRNLLIDTKRELDQHRKLRRYSKGSTELAHEFNLLVTAYFQKHDLLKKIETIIESLRMEIIQSGNNPAIQSKIKQPVQNAEKLKNDLLKTTQRLLDLREKIEFQVQKDKHTEENLLNTLKQCLQYLSSTERGKIEVTALQKIERLNIEDRIRFLSQLIEQLAQSVPGIRRNECERIFDLAKTKFRQKNYAEALLTLDQLFKFDKQHLLGHRLRAEIYKTMGNQFAYTCELRMITEMETAEGHDFFALAELMQSQGKNDDAYTLMEKCVAKEPSRKYMERLGDICIQAGHNYRAIPIFQEILAKNPNLVRAKHKLGNALYGDKHEDEGFNILREAIEQRDDNALSRVCVGRTFRHRKATFLADKCFARAVELNPDNSEAHYWWGMMIYDRGDFTKAAEHAKKVMKLEPNRPRNIVLFAKCLAASGKFQDSIEILLPMVSHTSPPPPVDMLLCFSEICRNANQIETAMNVIEPFHKKFPHQPQVKSEYSLLLVQSGRLAEAALLMRPSGI
jgi:tetratricopeptide (TPR) repeat protein